MKGAAQRISRIRKSFLSFLHTAVFPVTAALSQNLKVKSMFAQNFSSEVNHLPAVSISAQSLIYFPPVEASLSHLSDHHQNEDLLPALSVQTPV